VDAKVDWKKVADDRAWLLHAPSCVVSRAQHYCDGANDKYVSSVNNAAVDAPVMKLDDGNAFLAKVEDFILLSETEIVAFNAAMLNVGDALVKTTRDAVLTARAKGEKPLPPPTLNVLLICALKEQLAVLDGRHKALLRVAAQNGAPT
jgi:hypothetical protein